MTSLKILLNKNWPRNTKRITRTIALQTLFDIRGWPPIPSWLAIVFLAGGFLGFIDSSYLSVLHYKNIIPPCSVLGECETVLTSRYAVIGGVPVSLFGIVYYLALTVLSVLYFDTKRSKFMIVAMGMSVLGFVFTLWLFFLQVFVIKAFCEYCLFSAVITTTLFAGSLIFAIKNRDTL